MACPPNTISYTIVAGDTYFALARRYNTTVAAITAANPGVDPTRLRIGQVICIPTATSPGTCPPNTTAYTIVAGDTYFALARRYNTTVAAITAANPGVDPTRLRIGQVICIPVAAPPGTCPPNTTAYTIMAGDTYFALARRFNTTVAAITAANPGVDPTRLRIGQVICIPVSTPPVACPPNTVAYTIVAGDTLFALARRFNTTVAAIISANPGIDPNSLRIGQIICIPRQQTYPPCPEGNYYTVRAGDTFFSIAARFNVSVNDLMEANPGVDPRRLMIGQVICIPLATPPVTCPPGYRVHIVNAGETMFTLARRYGVSVQSIINANPGINPNFILIGQRLCIPPM